MSYKYLPHEADIGIEVIGDTVEEAFEEGAKALFNAMVEIEKYKPDVKVTVHNAASDLPSLFIEWLNEFIAIQDIDELILCKFKVNVLKKSGDQWILEGDAWGEPLKHQQNTLKANVKAATYGGLKYVQEDGKHKFTCILDV